ncbi:hypothetical protein [Chishuiella sp.]|uniref:hypothetical protein n=1 Tax=Chishuiella sp. TaxID=1969467 RepID=UPI0028ACC7D1|nr:hypothetical protein [Chishuiella sp.]
MFKKLNQNLITKYPLIWNLKYIWILLVALVINSIAFINGFLSFNKKSQLQEFQLFNKFINEGTFVYYIFISVILLIIWIYFYIKNNRFKSFYPTSRNYLFKEFLAVFSLFIVFLYIPNSYKLGIKTRVANYMSEDQYLKDIDIINRGQAFTLQYNFGYNSYSRNLSVPVFDTLVSEQQTRQLFNQNLIELKKRNPKLVKQFLEPYFRNDEFETLLAEHFPQRKSYQSINFNRNYIPLTKEISDDSEYPSSYNEESVVEAAIPYENDFEKVNDTATITYVNLASLYNYSSLAFENPRDSTKNHEYYDKELITLLQKNNRNDIQKLLNNYKELLDKNEIGYRFEHTKWIDYIPNYPYYFIDNQLSNYNNRDEFKSNDYINQSALNIIYSNVGQAKYQSFWLNNIQYYILSALVFTMLLITFRFSSFKVWLTTIIGAGILVILGSVIGLAFNYFLSSNYLAYIILFFFYVVFLILTFFGLKNGKNKLITGVNLNWFVLTNIFIAIFLLSFYTQIREDILYDYTQAESLYQFREKNKELQLLDQLADIFLYINPIIYVIAFYFIINLYKKWQAMPEE